MSPAGSGWTEKVLYSPTRASGYSINAGLTMDSTGNIFGATYTTVFELSPGDGGWTQTVIHNFTANSKDGNTAESSPVLDHAGNLYGTTVYGGANNQGIVYKLSPGKSGWTETILHNFLYARAHGANAEYPQGIVLDSAGNIYGNASGGTHGYGAVYEVVAPVGKGKYTEKVLWNFNVNGGIWPLGNLILDGAGNLYGTTFSSGDEPGNNGVVFEITP